MHIFTLHYNIHALLKIMLIVNIFTVCHNAEYELCLTLHYLTNRRNYQVFAKQKIVIFSEDFEEKTKAQTVHSFPSPCIVWPQSFW